MMLAFFRFSAESGRRFDSEPGRDSAVGPQRRMGRQRALDRFPRAMPLKPIEQSVSDNRSASAESGKRCCNVGRT
jgi:hypothetical protein